MNIYVGNLSSEVTEKELGLEFGAFGEVTSVVVISDKYTGVGHSSGHGFVQMASKSQGSAAIAALKGKNLKNRPIEVVEALPLSDRKTATNLSRKGNAPGDGGERGRH